MNIKRSLFLLTAMGMMRAAEPPALDIAKIKAGTAATPIVSGVWLYRPEVSSAGSKAASSEATTFEERFIPEGADPTTAQRTELEKAGFSVLPRRRLAISVTMGGGKKGWFAIPAETEQFSVTATIAAAEARAEKKAHSVRSAKQLIEWTEGAIPQLARGVKTCPKFGGVALDELQHRISDGVGLHFLAQAGERVKDPFKDGALGRIGQWIEDVHGLPVATKSVGAQAPETCSQKVKRLEVAAAVLAAEAAKLRKGQDFEDPILAAEGYSVEVQDDASAAADEGGWLAGVGRWFASGT